MSLLWRKYFCFSLLTFLTISHSWIKSALCEYHSVEKSLNFRRWAWNYLGVLYIEKTRPTLRTVFSTGDLHYHCQNSFSSNRSQSIVYEERLFEGISLPYKRNAQCPWPCTTCSSGKLCSSYLFEISLLRWEGNTSYLRQQLKCNKTFLNCSYL